MKTKSSNGEMPSSPKKQKPQKDQASDSSPSESEDDAITSALAASQANAKLGHLPSFAKARDSRRLIVVLEDACLESVKVGGSYELLNCDKHKQQILKMKKDPCTCRPDILHQCLLMLFDSLLNRANLLQVYVHTSKKVQKKTGRVF